MKRNLLNYVLVSAIGLLIFFGCSKEDNQTMEKQENVFQPSEQDFQIESKILAFKDNIGFARENPNLKSGGDDLTIEEAVWNIEALANYTYADASTPFDNYVGKSAEITIPLSEGKITILDASAAYDQVIDTLTAHYSQIPGTNKHLVLADISLKETDGETATFNVTSGVGDGPPNPFAGFGETDYWWFGNSIGKCGPYPGQGVGSDAAEEIERKINQRKSLPVGHRYFTDIKEIEFEGAINEIIYEPNSQEPEICECCNLTNLNDPTPNDNYFDRIVFYNRSDYQNFHGCLSPVSPDEMNFYLDNMEDLIYETIYDCFATQLEGKIFSRCNLWGTTWAPDPLFYFHQGYVYYGISVGSGDPPNEL